MNKSKIEYLKQNLEKMAEKGNYYVDSINFSGYSAWWRKHNACVFCKDEAHLYYMGVPICELCLNILGEVATDETAKEVPGDE